MPLDIPAHELARLLRTVAEHPGSVGINIIGWCVQREHVVQILYWRSAEHPRSGGQGGASAANGILLLGSGFSSTTLRRSMLMRARCMHTERVLGEGSP